MKDYKIRKGMSINNLSVSHYNSQYTWPLLTASLLQFPEPFLKLRWLILVSSTSPPVSHGTPTRGQMDSLLLLSGV